MKKIKKMNKSQWSLIYKLILAVWTGVGGTLGLQAMPF